MPQTGSMHTSSGRKAYIITGPTSGIGRVTALELAKHGTVVLVGRDAKKLDEVRREIEKKRQHAATVVCDLSDIARVRRAAAEIIALQLPIVGLLNNAGIHQGAGTKNALGWDMTFATNQLGPFALTEALAPHLCDAANVLFVVSAVEDPGRKPAVAVGFRGGRYISVEANARGEWKPGGSTMPGMDAYATSKQCILAAAMAFPSSAFCAQVDEQSGDSAAARDALLQAIERNPNDAPLHMLASLLQPKCKQVQIS